MTFMRDLRIWFSFDLEFQPFIILRVEALWTKDDFQI